MHNSPSMHPNVDIITSPRWLPLLSVQQDPHTTDLCRASYIQDKQWIWRLRGAYSYSGNMMHSNSHRHGSTYWPKATKNLATSIVVRRLPTTATAAQFSSLLRLDQFRNTPFFNESNMTIRNRKPKSKFARLEPRSIQKGRNQWYEWPRPNASIDLAQSPGSTGHGISIIRICSRLYFERGIHTILDPPKTVLEMVTHVTCPSSSWAGVGRGVLTCVARI